jgi:hypothetical protein
MDNKELKKVFWRVKANVIVPPVMEPTTTKEEPLAEDQAYLVTQIDLLTLESVLVSTGFNDNDDVFLSQELIGARGTGRHKPVNIEHDDLHIVGHMTESFVATKTGERINENVILDEQERLPINFDLVSRAVVYAYIFPELAREIREKAARNELFVSVEAWFQDYDYIVGTRIVRRNTETFEKLEPVLRINGGNGQINGQRLGRVLRGLIIGGKGLVEAPANRDSVIRSVSCEHDELVLTLFEENTIGHLIDGVFVPFKGETAIIQEEESMSKLKAAKKKEEKAADDKVKKEIATEDKNDSKSVKDEDETQNENGNPVVTEKPENKSSEENNVADDTTVDDQQEPTKIKEEPKDDWGKKLQEMADKLSSMEDTSKKEIEELKELLDSKDSKIKELDNKLTQLETQTPESETADSTGEVDKKELTEDKISEPKDTEPINKIDKDPKNDTDVDDSAIDDAVDKALDTADKEEDPIDFSADVEEEDEELQGDFQDVLTKLGMIPAEEEKQTGGS